jgi:hypothetical protein
VVKDQRPFIRAQAEVPAATEPTVPDRPTTAAQVQASIKTGVTLSLQGPVVTLTAPPAAAAALHTVPPAAAAVPLARAAEADTAAAVHQEEAAIHPGVVPVTAAGGNPGKHAGTFTYTHNFWIK